MQLTMICNQRKCAYGIYNVTYKVERSIRVGLKTIMTYLQIYNLNVFLRTPFAFNYNNKVKVLAVTQNIQISWFL